MKPHKNGEYVIEAAKVESGWDYYKLWMADRWICPECDHQIIAGFGMNPISIRHKEDWIEQLKSARNAQGYPIIVIKDR